MVVGTLRISLRLHGCRSLKEKRRPRRMLTDRIRSRFHVAVAEVDHQDTWNMLTLGVAAIGPDQVPVEQALRAVVEFVDSTGTGELVEDTLSFHRA